MIDHAWRWREPQQLSPMTAPGAGNKATLINTDITDNLGSSSPASHGITAALSHFSTAENKARPSNSPSTTTKLSTGH